MKTIKNAVLVKKLLSYKKLTDNSVKILRQEFY